MVHEAALVGRKPHSNLPTTMAALLPVVAHVCVCLLCGRSIG